MRGAVVRHCECRRNCGAKFVLTLQVLVCPTCEKQFGLTVGTGLTSLEGLSDPFDAICIHCEAISSFGKSAVRTLEVGSSRTPDD
jgi:hypothetical protein